VKQIRFESTFEGWKAAARVALAEEVPPHEVFWVEQGGEQEVLLLDGAPPDTRVPSPARVPREFMGRAKIVSRHSNPARWDLLYRILWRLVHGEADLLENPMDSDVLQFAHFEKEVEKDAYRMTAFLRFREVRREIGSWFVAWYEPEHDTLECNADFFVDRFANMRWSILTPRRCMHWDGADLAFTSGVSRASAPTEDEIEPLWLSYYSSIFNPARIKPRAMQAQLLKRNWKNLPEAAIIEPLLREAPRRVDQMLRRSAQAAAPAEEHKLAAPPETDDLEHLRAAAATCRACPLWRNAGCTVFGEGPRGARIMLVGEQPGDQEDRAGKPFVGPAGQILSNALVAAGLRREELYLTNAVKHFKWEPRGKRRIHKTPNSRDIASCRPWLLSELEMIKPRLVVSLGATALRSLFDQVMPVLENRGLILESPLGVNVLVTVHPSSLLRMPDEAARSEAFERFVDDLKKAKQPGRGK
jgi:probable DNA metabolism protein